MPSYLRLSEQRMSQRHAARGARWHPQTHLCHGELEPTSGKHGAVQCCLSDFHPCGRQMCAAILFKPADRNTNPASTQVSTRSESFKRESRRRRRRSRAMSFHVEAVHGIGLCTNWRLRRQGMRGVVAARAEHSRPLAFAIRAWFSSSNLQREAGCIKTDASDAVLNHFVTSSFQLGSTAARLFPGGFTSELSFITFLGSSIPCCFVPWTRLCQRFAYPLASS